MNFKIFLLSGLFILCSCGVKSQPLKSPETAVESYIESYTGNKEQIIEPKVDKAQPPVLEIKK